MYFRGSVIMSAISAIDIALWDIKGKALGVPVYELLGGKTREKVRVYASVMHLTEDNNELAKQYQQLQEMGFTAAKIFCNGPVSAPDGKGEFYSSRIEREVEKVRVCREAVGNDFDFVLEVHRGMTLPEAVAFGRAVEPYRPMILEDPVPPDNVDTMAEVASKVGVPIATGERFIDLREFEVLMARHKEVNNINEQPKNKNIFKIVISVCLVVITIVVIISAIGVNSGMSEEISTVKNGHFFDYPEEDGYTTIGTAFENYFDNTKWYYFVSDDGFDVVEFEGTFSYYDKDTSCCLQFKLYDDNHFEAYALDFNGVPQSKFMKNTLIDEVMEDARYIYDY